MDEFQPYRDLLAGKRVEIHEDQPLPGFYKVRKGAKDGPFVPVAIWRKDGNLVCRVGSEMQNPESIWLWAAKNPIPRDVAKVAFDTGSFPGDVEISAAADNPVSALTRAIDAANAWLSANKIADQVALDTAANHRAEVLRLKKACVAGWSAIAQPYEDAMRPHKEAMRPYKEALDALRMSYDTALKSADVINHALRAASGPYMQAEEDRLRREQEDAVRKAVMSGSNEPLPIAPPPKVRAGGQQGKRMALRSTWRAAITDFDAVLAHFKGHPDVVSVIEHLASVAVRAAKGDPKIPGVEAIEERTAQ